MPLLFHQSLNFLSIWFMKVTQVIQQWVRVAAFSGAMVALGQGFHAEAVAQTPPSDGETPQIPQSAPKKSRPAKAADADAEVQELEARLLELKAQLEIAKSKKREQVKAKVDQMRNAIEVMESMVEKMQDSLKVLEREFKKMPAVRSVPADTLRAPSEGDKPTGAISVRPKVPSTVGEYLSAPPVGGKPTPSRFGTSPATRSISIGSEGQEKELPMMRPPVPVMQGRALPNSAALIPPLSPPLPPRPAVQQAPVPPVVQEFRPKPAADAMPMIQPIDSWWAIAASPVAVTGRLTNGIGASTIEGEQFLMLNLAPEIELAEFAVGLDLPLRIHQTTGQIRVEDWNSANDVLRTVRYARYQSRDRKRAFRVGALEDVTLGTGSLVYRYRNTASIDDRRTGADLHLEMKDAEFRMFASSLTQAELFAGRLALRPQSDSLLRQFEIGFTYAVDFSPLSNLTAVSNPARFDNRKFLLASDARQSPFSGFTIDGRFNVVHEPLYDFTLSGEFTRLVGYGSGGSLGIEVTIQDPARQIWLQGGLRHLVEGEQYRAGYFGAFYDVERYAQTSSGTGDGGLLETKANTLRSVRSTSRFRGNLVAGYQERWRLDVSYEQGYAGGNTGLFYSGLRLQDTTAKLSGEVKYYKRNVRALGDFRVLDENTLIEAGVEYGFLEMLSVGLKYQWTFTPEVRNGGQVLRYVVQERSEPRLSVRWKF